MVHKDDGREADFMRPEDPSRLNPEEQEIATFVAGVLSRALSQRRARDAKAGPVDAPGQPELPPTEDGPSAGRRSRRRADGAPSRTPMRLPPRRPAEAGDGLRLLFARPGLGDRPVAGESTRPAGLSPVSADSPASPHNNQTFQRCLNAGIRRLDSALGGGFQPGLYVLAGDAGTGKTALMQSAAWEALSSGHPVVYYALKEGAEAAWVRLTSTGAQLLGPRGVVGGDNSPLALPAGNARLLEDTLESLVLPYLDLTGVLPPGVDRLATAVEDFRRRLHRAQVEHRLLPLLLVDDAEHLLRGTRQTSLGKVLDTLHRALSVIGVPGLLSLASPPGWPGTDFEPSAWLSSAPRSRPPRLLVLQPARLSQQRPLVPTVLQVFGRIAGGAADRIPVVFDHRSGLFAPAD